MSFSPLKLRFFAKKDQKILKFGKVRKVDDERVFSKKYAFLFLKGFFNKAGGVKICHWQPVVLHLLTKRKDVC